MCGITDPEVDSRLSGHVLWPLNFDSHLYDVRCSLWEYMLGSTADSCSCVRLRRLWCGCDIGSGMCKAGLLVTSHPALCSLPRWQVHEALHHGRYGPEGQLQWHVQGWYCWWQCTSRCVLFPGSQAHDARHHGRYGPKLGFSRSLTSLSCCRGPVAAHFRLSMPLLCWSSRFTSLS